MFEGKPWILTPPKGGGETAYSVVEAAAKALGAQPIRCDAALHDAQIALISHLPHLIAGALVIQAGEAGPQIPAGGSWRDATRVGGSNPELWTQIVMSNRREVLKALDDLMEQLGDARTALRRRNTLWLQTFFSSASETKRRGIGR
jgi:prephenate dehydrogenase